MLQAASTSITNYTIFKLNQREGGMDIEVAAHLESEFLIIAEGNRYSRLRGRLIVYFLLERTTEVKENAMSDNLRPYRAIRDAVIPGRPGTPQGQRGRHLTNPAALITGILASRRVRSPYGGATTPYHQAQKLCQARCPVNQQ